MPWNLVRTIFPRAQGGSSCTCIKSVLYLSAYSQNSRWMQEEFDDFRNDSSTRDIFHEMSLSRFWWSVRETNAQLSELAFRTLLPFSITYLCKRGFSSSSQQNKGMKSKESRGWQSSTVKHSNHEWKLAIPLQSQPSHSKYLWNPIAVWKWFEMHL